MVQLSKLNIMLERVVCPANYNQDSDLVLATIPNGDSFKLVYHFSPMSMPGARINLGSFDLDLTYWIYGYESNIIKVDKPSISDDMVIVDQSNSLIKVLFKNYNLNSGKLCQKLEFRLRDPQMPGSYSEESKEGFTGIIIK